MNRSGLQEKRAIRSGEQITMRDQEDRPFWKEHKVSVRMVFAMAFCLFMLSGLWGQNLNEAQTTVEKSGLPTWGAKETQMAGNYFRILGEDPGNEQVIQLLLDLYRKFRAEEDLIVQLKQQADGSNHPSQRLVIAGLLKNMGNQAEAKVHVQKVIEQTPDHMVANRLMWELESQSGNLEASLEWIRKLIGFYPQNHAEKVPLMEQMGSILSDLNRHEEASLVWKEALEMRPEDLGLMKRLSARMVSNGLFADAIEVYEKFLAQGASPSSRNTPLEQLLDAKIELSKIYEFKEEPEKSAQYLEETLQKLYFRDWKYEQLFLRRVRLAERFSLLEELETSLKQQAESLQDEKSWFDLVRFYQLTAQPALELATLEVFSQLKSSTFDYRPVLAESYLDNDEANKALSTLDALIRDYGEMHSLQWALWKGECLVRLGREKEVEDSLNRLLKLYREDEKSRLEIHAFAQKHRIEGFEENYYSEQWKLTGEERFFFEWAHLLNQKNRHEELEQIFNDYIKDALNEQERFQKCINLSRFLIQRGSGTLANRWIQQALKLNLHSPLAWVEFGQVLQELEAKSDSKEWMTEIIESLSTAVRQAILYARNPRGGVKKGTSDGKVQADEPLETLQASDAYNVAWHQADHSQDKLDADERLLAYLTHGHAGVDGKKISEEAEAYQENADPNILGDFGSGPDPSRLDLPQTVIEFMTNLKRQLNDESSAQDYQRVAWWMIQSREYFQAENLLKKDQNRRLIMEGEIPLEYLRLRYIALNALGNDSFELFELLPQLLQRDQERADLWKRRLAELWIRIPQTPQQYQDGIKLLKEMFQTNPEDMKPLDLLIANLELRGKLSEAVKILREAYLASNSSNRLSLLERYANTLCREGNYELALSIYTQEIQKERDDKRKSDLFTKQMNLLPTEVQSESSEAELFESKIQRYLSDLASKYEDLSRRNPLNAFYAEAVGEIRLKLNQVPQALAALKRAYYHSNQVSQQPDKLRDAAREAGDLDSAIYFQRQILSKNTTKLETKEWEELIQLLEDDFRDHEVRNEEDRMARRFSRHPSFIKELIHRRIKHHDFEGAIKLRSEYIQHFPNDLMSLGFYVIEKSHQGELDLRPESEDALRIQTFLHKTREIKHVHEQFPWPEFHYFPETMYAGHFFWKERLGSELIDFIQQSNDALVSASRFNPATFGFTNQALISTLDLNAGAGMNPSGLPLKESGVIAWQRLHVIALLAQNSKKEGAETLQQWINHWNDESQLFEERLWAFYHAGHQEGVWKLLKPYLSRRLNHVKMVADQFFIARVLMHSGNLKNLIDTLESERSPWWEENRSSFLMALSELAVKAPEKIDNHSWTRIASSPLLETVWIYELCKILTPHDEKFIVFAEGVMQRVDHWFRFYLLHRLAALVRESDADKSRSYLTEASQIGLHWMDSEDMSLTLDAYFSLVHVPIRSSIPDASARSQYLEDLLNQVKQAPPSFMQLRILGMIYFSQEKYKEGVDSFLKAWSDFLPLQSLSKIEVSESDIFALGRQTIGNEFQLGFWKAITSDYQKIKRIHAASAAKFAKTMLSMKAQGVQAVEQVSSLQELQFLMLDEDLNGFSWKGDLGIFKEFMSQMQSIESLVDYGDHLLTNSQYRFATQIFKDLPPRASTNTDYSLSLMQSATSSGEILHGLSYLNWIIHEDVQNRPMGVSLEKLHRNRAFLLYLQGDAHELEKMAFSAGSLQVGESRNRRQLQEAYLEALATLHVELENWVEAEKALDDLSTYPSQENSPSLCLRRGLVLYAQGKKEAARERLREFSYSKKTYPMGEPKSDAYIKASLDLYRYRMELAAEVQDVAEMEMILLDLPQFDVKEIFHKPDILRIARRNGLNQKALSACQAMYRKYLQQLNFKSDHAGENWLALSLVLEYSGNQGLSPSEIIQMILPRLHMLNEGKTVEFSDIEKFFGRFREWVDEEGKRELWLDALDQHLQRHRVEWVLIPFRLSLMKTGEEWRIPKSITDDNFALASNGEVPEYLMRLVTSFLAQIRNATLTCQLNFLVFREQTRIFEFEGSRWTLECALASGDEALQEKEMDKLSAMHHLENYHLNETLLALVRHGYMKEACVMFDRVMSLNEEGYMMALGLLEGDLLKAYLDCHSEIFGPVDTAQRLMNVLSIEHQDYKASVFSRDLYSVLRYLSGIDELTKWNQFLDQLDLSDGAEKYLRRKGASDLRSSLSRLWPQPQINP